ncbi:MAG: hypothetical protein SWQ30_23255, partial [Thermodesulfobacteriota bacterium]|nr:hypothetical protein [Thermodesulfobacteriota bacterium]
NRWTLPAVALSGESLSATLRTPPSGWVRDLLAALLPRAAAHPLAAGHARHTTSALSRTRKKLHASHARRSATVFHP